MAERGTAERLLPSRLMRKSATPALAILILALAGCSSAPSRSDVAQVPVAPFSSATTGPPQALQAVSPTASGDAFHDVATDAEPVAAVDSPKAQRGLASWYGARFQGQRTASGKSFDMNALTAAHPKLPLGSYARVTLLSTGKSVVVHITDRGPYKKHRIIDLSRAAAARLGLLKHGVGKVAVQQVAPPDQVATADPVTSTE